MPIQPDDFTQAMSRFASGVTVVTTCYQGEVHGMTASSFCSLSLLPPLVLVCVGRQADSHALIQNSGEFAVNILHADQLEWGKRFAGLIPDMEDRFDGIPYHTSATASPILPGVLSWVDCTLRNAYDGGDHTIFVGEVISTGAHDAACCDDIPLLYYNRRWRRLG